MRSQKTYFENNRLSVRSLNTKSFKDKSDYMCISLWYSFRSSHSNYRSHLKDWLRNLERFRYKKLINLLKNDWLEFFIYNLNDNKFEELNK